MSEEHIDDEYTHPLQFLQDREDINRVKWVHILFVEKEDHERLNEIKEELFERGVYFDAGEELVRGIVEWHTDWSLTGPMSVRDICEYLAERRIEYRIQVVPSSEEE